MDSSIPSSSLRLFKEVSTSLDTLARSVVIRIPLPSSSTLAVRSRQQARILRGTTSYKDEDAFSKQHLASSSSVFFGHPSSYPRSILWRILQEDKVLELRSLDFSKNEQEPNEALFILQLHLPVPIKRGGVALADAEDGQILSVFALTKANDLYTCAIKKEYFCHPTVTHEDVGSWCKVYRPATFSMSSPHRLVCGSSTQIIVSLTDGRLLQLTRARDGDGSKWVESTYGDGQWGASLRGLVRWQGSNAVRYEGSSLEQTTPLAMSVSPDKKHIFAVCLNHTLRIWNPNKAANVFSKDLLLQHREPQDISKVLLDPANPNLLQLFQATSAVDGDLYYAVTFSPHDLGEFKFWGVRDPDFGDQGVRDLYPELAFKPPDPDPNPNSKAIWRVIDFKISGDSSVQGTEMWILMRSNRHHQAFRLRFDLDNLPSQWQDRWCMVDSRALPEDPTPQYFDSDPQDPTEKWLDYIFHPGRYSEPLLQLAVRLYHGGKTESKQNMQMSTQEQIASAVGSRLGNNSSGDDPFALQKSIQREWNTLHQCIQDLDRLGWDCISLAYDNADQLPWIVFTGGVSVIRSLSRTEIICDNTPKELGKSMHLLEIPSIEVDDGDEPRLPDELATVVEAATKFRESFSVQLQHKVDSKLAAELWLNPSYSIPLRMQAFYDECNFMDNISGEQFDGLTKNLGAIGGFQNLDTSIFRTILDTLSHDISARSSELVYTVQGLQILINGARDIITQTNNMLSDLLNLVVIIDMEVDREETPMEKFDAAEVYSTILSLLREYQIMRWLVCKLKIDRSSNTEETERGTEVTHQDRITILESIFARDLKPQSTETQSKSEAITYSIRDLLKWVVGGNDPAHPVDFEDVPVYIQCDLLKNRDLDSAIDFLRFQPSTAWSTYIKGRLSLARNQPSEAAVYFKKAAYKLSRPTTFDYLGASNGLLTPIEAAYFGQGIPVFYTHIINLFDSSSHPTQSAQFAQLALQPILPTPADDHDLATTDHLLTSLFYASLKTTDIPTAFSALIRHPSPSDALLPALLRKLLSDQSLTQTLLTLPFPPNLHNAIDILLESASPPAPKVLAAWRMHHDDFRGAAAALLPSLQQQQRAVRSGRPLLQRAGKGAETEKSLDESYLSVINLLACAGEGEDWLLSGGSGNGSGSSGDGLIGGKGSGPGSKRELVTLHDVRASYQRELDRRSILETGRFEFGILPDQMDVS